MLGGNRTFRSCLAALTISGAIIGASATCSFAQQGFFQGRQLHLIVSAGAGGIYDSYARLVARFLPDHIPGRPNIVVQSMPGSSGVKATNYLYNEAPRDGSYIAAVHNGIPTAPFEQPQITHFDVNALSWIGSVGEDPFVGYVWHTSVGTYEEAKAHPVILGTSSMKSMGAELPIVSNVLFGTQFKVIPGYEDSPTQMVAIEKGELQGIFGDSWGDIRTQKPDWIDNHLVHILIQTGNKREPSLPDVPLLIDQAKTDDDRQLLNFLLARQEFSRPYIAPPGVPKDRLEILRQAFDATVRDPQFIDALRTVRLTAENPMSGDMLAKRVWQLSLTPQSVKDRLTKIFADYLAQQH